MEFQGWDTPYVHDTVDVLTPESGTTALGSVFGSRKHINGASLRRDALRDWQRRSCTHGDGPHVPHAHQRGCS